MRDLDVRWLGRCEYRETVALQLDLVARRRRGEAADTLLLLEHDPVITVGRGGSATLDAPPSMPVVETSRGGQATYHGPGQLVAYPVLDLRQWRCDLHWYLRELEQAIIAGLALLGTSGSSRESYTGVWIGERKVASIGVAVRGWITYHGVALNVDCDLAGFGGITPCGLPSETMTSLATEGLPVTMSAAAAAVELGFRRRFGF